MGDVALYEHILNLINDPSSIPNRDSLYLTARFDKLTHYDQTIKTGNGFLYSHGGEDYLVTTAHLLFDTNQSTDSSDKFKATELRCGKTVIYSDSDTVKGYISRFFDVAVFNVTSKSLGNGFSADDVSSSKPNNVNVKHIDPNTGNNVSTDTKYLNLANASVEMGAICHKLIQGASGAAVTDDVGKLVGMVSSCVEQYDNMSLCVPVSVVKKIIEDTHTDTIDAGKGKNYDTNSFYPGVLTVPLQMGHLQVLPSEIEQGEVVVQTDGEINVKPFDIITKVDNVVVGRENKLATQALVGNSASMKVRKLSDSWRKIYGALPRSISYYNGETPYDGTDDSTTDDYIHNEIIVSELFGEIYIDGNTITVGDSEYDDELISDTGSRVLYNNILHRGCLVKFINDNGDKTVFASVTSISTSGSPPITTITIDKTLDSNMTIMIIFPFSSIYTENCNDNALGVFDIISNFSASKYIEPGTVTPFGENSRYAKLTKDAYNYNCIEFVVKYWTTLVCSNLMKIPMGQQHIVWAKEVQRLLGILINVGSLSNTSSQFRLIMNIFYKILEFNEISTMNLLNILVQNIIEKTNMSVNDAKNLVAYVTDFFPIVNNTNSLSNSINLFGKKLFYKPFAPLENGEDYVIYLFSNDSYNIIAGQNIIINSNIVTADGGNLSDYVGGSIDSFDIANDVVINNDSVTITIDSAATATDWVGIYKRDDTPGVVSSIRWGYVYNNESKLDMINNRYFDFSTSSEFLLNENNERVVAPILVDTGTISFDSKGNKFFEIVKIGDLVDKSLFTGGRELEVRLFQPVPKDYIFYMKVIDQNTMEEKIHQYIILNVEPYEDVLLLDNISGDSTFNAEGYSAEHYHQKNTIAKAVPRQIPADNVGQNLELCYKELEYLCDVNTDFGDDGLYYPRFFGLLQYFWNKAHITLGGIMTTLDSNAFDAETTVTITKSVLPAHLGTWNFDRLLGNNSGGS